MKIIGNLYKQNKLKKFEKKIVLSDERLLLTIDGCCV